MFSDFSMECDKQLFQNRAKNDIPTFLINSEEGLSYLYKKEHGKDIEPRVLEDSFNEIYKVLTKDLQIETGIPLSKLPDILIENKDKFERLNVRIPK